MIKVEPSFTPIVDRSPSPLVVGVTRSLSAIYEPLLEQNLPDNLAELVRRLDRREQTG